HAIRPEERLLRPEFEPGTSEVEDGRRRLRREISAHHYAGRPEVAPRTRRHDPIEPRPPKRPAGGRALLERDPSDGAVAAEEDLLGVDARFATAGDAKLVGSVSVQDACFDIVAHVDVEDVVADNVLQYRIEHRHDGLYPAVEVPAHPVRAADVHLALAGVCEHEDARVLEKTAHDAAHANRFADA